MLEPGSRVKLIQSVREELQPLSLEDEALVLEEFGIGARPLGRTGFDVEPTLTAWLQQADEARVVALARHLGVIRAATEASVEDDVRALPDDEPAPLFMFASHISRERRFVGDVETALRSYGVELFVAHDSIPMDAEWQPEIAEALSRCHAGVAFIHSGFSLSAYCQQEVGWLLGRGVPLARLMSGEAPAALLSQRQGKPIDALGAEEVAAEIITFARERDELRSHLITSLSNALVGSSTYNMTDRIWKSLPDSHGLTEKQAETILLAAEVNSQVYGAGVGGWGGRRYRNAIADLVEDHCRQESLTERIARLRKNANSGLSLRDSSDE